MCDSGWGSTRLLIQVQKAGINDKDTSIAYVRRNVDGPWAPPPSLINHFEERSRLASKFTETLNSSSWAYAARLGHDLGKAIPAWQHCLGAKMGKQEHSSLTADVLHEAMGLHQVMEHQFNLGEVQLLSAKFLSSTLAVVQEYAKSALSSSYSATWPVQVDRPGNNIISQRSPQYILPFQFQSTVLQYFAISENEVW